MTTKDLLQTQISELRSDLQSIDNKLSFYCTSPNEYLECVDVIRLREDESRILDRMTAVLSEYTKVCQAVAVVMKNSEINIAEGQKITFKRYGQLHTRKVKQVVTRKYNRLSYYVNPIGSGTGYDVVDHSDVYVVEQGSVFYSLRSDYKP